MAEIRKIVVEWSKEEAAWKGVILRHHGDAFVVLGGTPRKVMEAAQGVFDAMEEPQTPSRSNNPFVKLDNALDRAILALWSE